jgi:hypothetical protein
VCLFGDEKESELERLRQQRKELLLQCKVDEVRNRHTSVFRQKVFCSRVKIELPMRAGAVMVLRTALFLAFVFSRTNEPTKQFVACI